MEIEEEEEEKKKDGKEAYATEDPTADTTAKEQEEMAKEAIKKFKALGGE